MNMKKNKEILVSLPGLDCGLCGSRTCNDFAEKISKNPEERERCVHLIKSSSGSPATHDTGHCGSCASCVTGTPPTKEPWRDSLGREFDFILDMFPDEPGPRETIIPRNPMLTREMEITKGDILIGRPLGMSCGCPVTHCGVVTDVDPKTGVIVWCVTGPLGPRRNAFKDIGVYSAEAYEGRVHNSRTELKIGMRYFFMPHKCMLQWRHSGLINFIKKTKDCTSIRIEGLWIG
jgi:uncharacterized Fe-S cluster-containing protein